MDERPLSSAFKDVMTSISGLIRSEVRLAKVEMKQSVRDAGKHAGQTALYGALIYFGSFCLLAFAVIGLGELFGGNFWLSSLLVGLALVVPGAVLLMRTLKQFKEDVTFEHTLHNLETDKDILNNNVRQLSMRPRQAASVPEESAADERASL